jgi:hypothetical protein
VDTLPGPVYLAVGLADTGQHALYFYIGRTFCTLRLRHLSRRSQ